MLFHKKQIWLGFILCLTLILWFYKPVFALEADTSLEIRDHCNESKTCTSAQVVEKQRISAITHQQGDEFSVDIFIQNPSRQKIVSVQSWLEYNSTDLEGLQVDSSSSIFEMVAPGEKNFDATKGLIKIWRSTFGNNADATEVFVANIKFKVKTSAATQTLLKFYDYQLSELGHTSVRVMEDNFPVNVLAGKPQEFVINLNGGPVISSASTSIQNNSPVQTTPDLTLPRPNGVSATTAEDYIFLMWDEISDPTLKGYNLYYSSTSGHYLKRRSMGSTTQYELNHLVSGQVYYLAVTAYDQYGRETDYSDEIRITVGDPASSSAPIVVTRDEYLEKVPQQPAN